MLFDRWYQEEDELCVAFVRKPKGMVPCRSGQLVGTPISEGGMGMHQLYRACQHRVVTTMQHTAWH